MSNARYSLNVYDPETDEIIKTLESRGIMWGALVDIYETVAETDDLEENLRAMEDLIMNIFPRATREDVRGCYIDDMMSVINQVMALGTKNGLLAKKPKKGKTAKN